VPEAVVDLLEAVEVEQYDADVAGVRRRRCCGEGLVEGVSVGEAGQRVGVSAPPVDLAGLSQLRGPMRDALLQRLVELTVLSREQVLPGRQGRGEQDRGADEEWLEAVGQSAGGDERQDRDAGWQGRQQVGSPDRVGRRLGQVGSQTGEEEGGGPDDVDRSAGRVALVSTEKGIGRIAGARAEYGDRGDDGRVTQPTAQPGQRHDDDRRGEDVEGGEGHLDQV
jgi:hypothetical protein